MDIQTGPDPVARARELGAQIAAAADQIERTRRIPEALLERLHDSRLFRMLLPRSAGGDETEPAVYMAAVGLYHTVLAALGLGGEIFDHAKFMTRVEGRVY